MKRRRGKKERRKKKKKKKEDFCSIKRAGLYALHLSMYICMCGREKKKCMHFAGRENDSDNVTKRLCKEKKRALYLWPLG